MLFTRFVACVALLGLLQLPVTAQSNNEIVISGSIDVAIAPFSGSSASESAAVLQNDLKMLGYFNFTGTDSASFVAKATLTGSGLQGILSDRGGSVLINETYTGNWRQATHQFADAIVEKITGTKGIATSNVVFVSAQSGHKELYVMDMDGQNVRQLTKDGVISLGPKFSKNNNQIAYTSYKSGYPDVWIISLSDSNRRRVSFYPGVNSGAAFSPDGSRLALTLSKDGNTELYTLSSSGGGPERLTRTRGTEASPTWSPDGGTLAYISDDRGTPQLYTIPAQGGSAQRVNTYSSYTTEPDWSPDGAALVYSVQAAGQNQIAFTNVSTGKQSVLTSGGTNETPSWTRNSRHIIFARSGKLYLIDSVTRKTYPIENGMSRCSEPNASN